MSKIKGFLDRGAAKYVHGRTDILGEFKKRLKTSMKSKGGTTFLLQGPLGVGKTVLLSECWDVAEIDPEDLWDPDKLRKTLGLRAEERIVRAGGEAGVDKVIVLKGKQEIIVDNLPRTPLDILQLGSKPLLLVLDEAQHLGKDGGASRRTPQVCAHSSEKDSQQRVREACHPAGRRAGNDIQGI